MGNDRDILIFSLLGTDHFPDLISKKTVRLTADLKQIAIEERNTYKASAKAILDSVIYGRDDQYLEFLSDSHFVSKKPKRNRRKIPTSVSNNSLGNDGLHQSQGNKAVSKAGNRTSKVNINKWFE